jgi:putative photosynthetic complex assembly protein
MQAQAHLSPNRPAQARPSDDKDMIPKPLLLAMLSLVLASLAVVSFAVLTGRAHVGVPKSANVVAERSVILQGGGAQAVAVLGTDGKLLMNLPHGGFITVIQNGMERARLTAGVDKLLPLRIVEYANGRLAAVDDYSGWSAELGAFGSDNRAAFERLMSQH